MKEKKQKHPDKEQKQKQKQTSYCRILIGGSDFFESLFRQYSKEKIQFIIEITPFTKAQLKKSRQYFPSTIKGQKEYEKQWKNDKQCKPTRFRVNYSDFTPASNYPKTFNQEGK